MKHLLYISVLFFTTSFCFAQLDPLLSQDAQSQKQWVDKVYNNMTIRQRIAQLFVVDASSKSSLQEQKQLEKLIDEELIGGVIFMKGTPHKQIKLHNKLQKRSKFPLLVSTDAEWGLSMRLDSTFAYPWNMTLGAVQDPLLVERAARRISKHCQTMGIHMNFAPVVDINTNPSNPIIGNRSFGSDKEKVTEQSIAFMRGMHQQGVLSCAKHFPGHGDTQTDSHKTLPTIGFSRERILDMELYPFKKLFKQGLKSVMIAHLNIPSLTHKEGLPSTLSKEIVTDLLQDQLGFRGLIITDALNMKGVANYKKPGAVDLDAFLAGNDILLMSQDPKAGISLIEKAYQKGLITEERLSRSVHKVLKAKYLVGLSSDNGLVDPSTLNKLHILQDDLLKEQLMESALTVVHNPNGILPIRNLSQKRIAYVHVGTESAYDYTNMLDKYASITQFDIKDSALLTKLHDYNLVIVGYHRSDKHPWKSYKFSSKQLVIIDQIATEHYTVLSIFTRPYTLLQLSDSLIGKLQGIVMAYQNNKEAQQKTAQLLFGAIESKGKLPVDLSPNFPLNTGVFTPKLGRLSYGSPLTVGVNPQKLKLVDTLVQYAIKEGMTPGAQLLVARKGKVIYQKSYGYHTYQKVHKVQDTDIYDVASLTKILATLPLTMELSDKGVVKLDSRLGGLIHSLDDSDKKNITIKQMLSHYARLQSWIPFYLQTLDQETKKPIDTLFSERRTRAFPTKVAPQMYISKKYTDTMFTQIKNSPLREQLKYKYSDLPYYILKEFLEDHYNRNLDELTQQHFYKRLGANHTGYLPLSWTDSFRIPPTEEDDYFRFQQVKAHVHDMGAAMQGGIGGHAGIFSNTNDIAKIMQMYLNGGYYGGDQFISRSTLDAYNTQYYLKDKVRRAVGFDKPQLPNQLGPTCEQCVSSASFGHTGFTGTMAWADPVDEVVYVFLSNRTYPTMSNNALVRNDIRSEIQRLIHESIIRD